MNKIIIPLLMIMTLSLSGCIYDPFYWNHGRGWDRGGWDYDGGRGDWHHGGHHDD